MVLLNSDGKRRTKFWTSWRPPLVAAAVHDLAGGVADLFFQRDLKADDEVLAHEHRALAILVHELS